MQRHLYCLTSLAALALATAASASAAITVTSAKIAAGRLVVTGSSPTGTLVKLDNAFFAPINAARNFSFSLVYLPLSVAAGNGWIVLDMKNDWNEVFPSKAK